MTRSNRSFRRRSIRHKTHDYSSAGAYFVTICVRKRLRLLSRIRDGRVVLTDAGAVVEEVWHMLPGRYTEIDLDAFVIMPDHVHGIIWIRDNRGASNPAGMPSPVDTPDPADVPDALDVPAPMDTPRPPDTPNPPGQPTCAIHPTHPVRPIHESALLASTSQPQQDASPHTAKHRRQMLLPKVIGYFKMNTAKRINRIRHRRGAFWQEDYYEHIIRSARALQNIRRYIKNNPRHWPTPTE